MARCEVLIQGVAAGNKPPVTCEHRVLFVACELRDDHL